MDSISNPWWLGGNICSGTVTGGEIARKLGARCWVSAHDADKDVRGFGTGLLKTKRWERQEIMGIVGLDPGLGDETSQAKGSATSNSDTDKGIEILRLDSGEEVLVTGDGMVLAPASMTKKNMKSIGEEENIIQPPALRQQATGGRTLGHRRSKRLLI
jgi:hypothetical protein